MAEASTARGEARRQEILAGALPLFLERGVAGVTLEQIRRASGASTGSIYHLFGSKESIAAAVYVDSLASYQGAFLDALWEDEGAEEGIRSVVRFHLDWCRSHPDLARFLFTIREPGVVTAARERMEPENQRFISDVGSWWRVHAHHGALRRMTPEQSYALWIGPAMELVRNWLTRGADPPTDEDAEVLSAAAWRALGNEGEARYARRTARRR
jgi:AcrR family transcriptional regulator